MKRRRAVKPRGRGFTLIEVLVALAIVAIGMAAVLGALTSSASTVVYMKDKTQAQWIALNHIAEKRLQNQAGQVPKQGNSDGDIDYAGQKMALARGDRPHLGAGDGTHGCHGASGGCEG